MAEKVFTLRFELYSSRNDTVVTTEISFDSMPKSFQQISREIEDIYSIPQCVQRISVCYPDYCHEVKGMETPASLYIRSGDLLRISFPLRGECREVKHAKNLLFIMVETVSKLYNAATNKEDENYMGMKFVTKYVINNTLRADKLAVSLSLFYTWTDIAHINKLFFVSQGGMDLLVKFYDLVVSFRKKQITLREGDLFEVVCVHTMSSFTGSVEFNHCVANQTCLELFLDTFLWKPINSEDISDLQVDAIQVALQAICNILVPDHYAELDRSYEVIVQTIMICMSPLYQCKTVITSMMLLTCMTYCCELCVNLVPKIFIDVLNILSYRKGKHADDTAALAVLEAYAATLISLQIINDVGAYQKYKKSLLVQITELLRKVCDSDPSVVRTYEKNAEFFWGSSLPALTSLYRPDNGENCQSRTNSLYRDITQLCTQTLLHTLHIILGHHNNLVNLFNENLFDYVVCLPSIVPSHSHQKAQAVVQEVGKQVQLQPLSLHSLAKAKLAKMKYGLQKVMKAITVTDLLHP